jgi:antirestriction protein ArdC
MKEVNTSDLSFVRFCIAELGIQTSPNIKIGDDHAKAQEHRAMGYYSPAENYIWVLRGSRVPADWYRTLAHELVHWRQREEDKPIDGADGSEIENEANSKAAVLLREWGRRDESIYVLPIEEQPADPQAEPATP